MSRVLILANEHVSRRMAGPAIRCYEFARELSARGHTVTLASPFPSDLTAQPFAIETYDSSTLERLARRHDVTVMQGYVLDRFPGLRDAAARLVVDLYDPFPLEEMLISAHAPMQARMEVQDKALRAVSDGIRDGDFFLCASEKQRDYWLGALSALNRVNPHTYSDDSTLRTLIDVVPFGVPPEPPRREAAAIRGVLPGVGQDDFVMLWGGGIYAWFDPLTVIRGVAIAAPSCPQLRLVFMSTGHPNPDIQEMWTNREAQRLAGELELTGRHVFFNPDWVPYHRRADWLLDADVGVTAHFDHVETRFSFRTRVLDYLWAGLPVICTAGDTLADAVERRGLGITVPAEDAGAVAAAIEALAGDPATREAQGMAAAGYAASLTWPAAVAPLARYCADPRPAPDRAAVAPLRRVPLPISRVPDGASTRNGAAPAVPVAAPASETEALRRDLHSLRGHLDSIERSHSFRAAQRASRTVRRVLPAGSPQRTAVGAVARRLGVLHRSPAVAGDGPAPVAPGAAGSDWVGRDLAWSRSPSRGDLDWQAHLATTAAEPVGFAVVVLSDSGPVPLQATLDSIEAQSWPFWQALVVEPEVVTRAPADSRVRRFHSLEPLATVNALLEKCPSRDLVVLLHAGDTLEPGCLFEAAGAALRDPIVDLVHWDDRVSADGGPGGTARVRPGWSPETLLSANYLDSSFAIRHRRFAAAGGLRPESGDAAVWDLLLRAELGGEEVIRLPRLLGMLRRDRGRATEAGRRAVDRLLARRGWPAMARLHDGAVTVGWELERWPAVSVVIPTRHNRALLGPLLEGLEATAYPGLEVVVVDNGRRTAENERWYEERAGRLPLRVRWWDRPFNYSAVNNAGAGDAAGELLVFLNDDIEVVDPGWLRELAGWATREQIGCVGLQLTAADGSIQHGGVVIGADGGFAGHLFGGLRPGDDTLLGSTRWYRDVTAVTGACLAIRRDLYERVGGFDERMVLCGSDVALGITAGIGGLRNLCSAATPMRHLESATRGTSAIPEGDFHASYWRYQPLLHGGDPWYSPALSLEGPAGVSLREPGEPTPLDRIGPVLGRSFEVYRQRSDAADSTYLAKVCRATRAEVEAVGTLHRRSPGRIVPRTVNWFIPGIDSPFYGGINTAFRIADHLTRRHGVANRFVVTGVGPEPFMRAAIAAAFPRLAGAEIVFLASHEDVDQAPAADVGVATLWTTAYQVARAPGLRRKFYLVQDFEPCFYPAGTMYALAEESYRLGLYAICNTANLGNIYRHRYGGQGMSFLPAVDTSVFHARGREEADPAAPPNLFVYARPGHWRNCWELASVALAELKQRLGDRVRIVTAGSWAMPEDSQHMPALRHLGLLDYRATGELYRRCDMGLVLTVSEHPSYLPLELMACGAVPVAFDNPAGHWLLEDGENSVLTPRTVDGLADGLERLAVDPALRRRLSSGGLRRIAAGHADWDRALAPIFDYLSDPEGSGQAPAAAPPVVSGRSRAEV